MEIYLQKELKQMVRNGIPTCYRSKLWKILIDRQVNDIKNSKGPNYFAHLCNIAPESNVSRKINYFSFLE